MARMSIDDKVCRDPRITVLAEALGWTRRETLGCLIADVWAICYDQETHLVSERIIDAAAGLEGFAKTMIECELATRDRSGKVLIKGAKERIEYLDHKRRAGREGGLKSAERRTKPPKQTSSISPSRPQAAGNPPVPDPVPASAPDLVLAPPPAQKKAAPSRDHVSPGYAETVELFYSRFQFAYGSKPSWGQKQGAQIKNLLKSHGATEVQRRIAILFDSPPSWLKPPFDLGTLVQHFDKLVVASVGVARGTGRIEPKQPDEYPEGDLAL